MRGVGAPLWSAFSAPASILLSPPALAALFFFFFLFFPIEPPAPALGDCDWSDELGDRSGGEPSGEPPAGGGLGE